jgi:hypothetical protein
MTTGIIGACNDSVAQILRGFGEREITILRGRVLSLATKRTLQQIATDYSLTRERVRQIEEQVISRITKRVRSPLGELLRRSSRYLKGAMGAACPVGNIVPERISRNVPGHGVTEDLTLGMLIWLAGPYEVYRGWLVRGPSESLVSLTKSVFRRLGAKEEPRDIRTVVDALSEVPVHERWALDWLSTVEKVKVFDGKICSWNGDLPSKAYLVLKVRGTVMTADDICRDIGDACNRRSLLNCLQSHPDRFRKSGPGLFSLTEWGGPEYTSVKEFVVNEIKKLGGKAKKELLIEKTMNGLAVPKRTVMTALSNPVFVQTGAGYVRVRSKADPMPRINPIEFSKHCYRLSHGDGANRRCRAWSYRVKVDSETLRGSGTVIPAAFGSLMGLRPGERVIAKSEFGEVQFSWNGPQAGVGSLRPAANGLDASVGDFLYVSITDPATVEFSLLRAQELAGVSGWERICLLVARTKGDSKEARIGEVGVAIGLNESVDFTIGDIRRRLEMRREQELLELIPESDLSDESDDLSELLEYALHL